MHRHLYFICPTDCLEAVINHTFKHENYFVTSLGNAIIFDVETVGQINGMIEAKEITEITFVLSDNNQIILETLNSPGFQIKGLQRFHNEIRAQKEKLKYLWETSDLQVPIVSNYLNLRIQELQSCIKTCNSDQIKIKGKIYSRENNSFKELQADLFCSNYFSFN